MKPTHCRGRKPARRLVHRAFPAQRGPASKIVVLVATTVEQVELAARAIRAIGTGYRRIEKVKEVGALISIGRQVVARARRPRAHVRVQLPELAWALRARCEVGLG